MIQISNNAILVKKVHLSDDLVKLTFESDKIAPRLEPGNFVHIRVSSLYDPLFRRAMSVHGADGDRFSVLFRVIGKGTRMLAQFDEGDTVNMLGPLGNSFCLPSDTDRVLLVAGGTGVPPLHFLAGRLLATRRPTGEGILFLCGVSCSKDEPLCEEVRRLHTDWMISSDDGSLGHRGYVTDLLAEELIKADPGRTKVYSCGPENMLRCVSGLCAKMGFTCQLSLEGSMPCGVGTCLGCVVQASSDTNEFKRICKDGPVFDGGDVTI